MQPPTTKSRSLNQGMPLHVALGEAAHACKSTFLSPERNQSTQLHMKEATQLLGENVHF